MGAKTKNKKTTLKYNWGSFVSDNSGKITGAINSAAQTTGSGVLSGAATGASVGSIFPGVGTLIGAGVGAIGGIIGGIVGNKRKEKERARELEVQRRNMNLQETEAYEANVNTINNNPYGIYEEGGEVFPNIINIEEGELQIDPNTGKILREYKGVNPETGGTYKPHNNKGGEDPEDNFVVADPGTFIITKEEAKKYKDAIDNNDTLTRETIMQNIRNKKKKVTSQQGKYADGDLVRKGINPIFPEASILPNDRFTGPTGPFGGGSTADAAITGGQGYTYTPGRDPNFRAANESPDSFSWADGLSLGAQALPAVANIFQGTRSPNYMPQNRVGMDIEGRRRILSNLPEEVSANPALSNIRGQQYNRSREISRTTGDPNLSRAVRAAGNTEAIRQENEAYYTTALANNQIRAQNASLLSGLSESDTRREMFNLQNMNQINQINRQMGTAKTQQLNTGLSQIGRAVQGRVNENQRRIMEDKMLDVMKEIFPEGDYLFNAWRRGR